MVRGDARQGSAHRRCGRYLDRAANEYVVEPQNRRPSVERRQRLAVHVRKLGIPHAAGKKPIGPGLRRGVEIAEKDRRIQTAWVAEPIGAEQRVRLGKLLPPAQREVRIDDLNLSPISTATHRALRFSMPGPVERSRQATGPDHARPVVSGEDGYPELLSEDADGGLQVDIHAKLRGKCRRLIDGPCPRAPDADLLQGHDIGLARGDHVGNAARRDLTIGAEPTMHIVG